MSATASRWHCDACDAEHDPTPCCGEQECVEPWACRRCHAVCCDCCGSGGMCMDCDTEALIESEDE